MAVTSDDDTGSQIENLESPVASNSGQGGGFRDPIETSLPRAQARYMPDQPKWTIIPGISQSQKDSPLLADYQGHLYVI